MMRRDAASGRLAVAVVALAALALGIMPINAAASELPDGEQDETRLAIRDDPTWTASERYQPGMALWFWPEGDRAFQVLGDTVPLGSDSPTPQERLEKTSGTGQFVQKTPVVAYDTTTLAEVAATELAPPVWGGTNPNNEYTTALGKHHVGAVDRQQGRVFFAYRTQANTFAASGDAPCPAPGDQAADLGCLGGIHVLDATTLEPLQRVPMTLPTLEGPRVRTVPRALEYAPADPDLGLGGRVLMVVEEIATGPLENSAAPSFHSGVQYATPRRNSGNIAYAVQFDPDSGRQDWAVRLEGCRNGRESRSWLYSPEPHPATIFRAGGPDPAIYVGCHGNPAQQGVVVRVPLDAEGFPAALPVAVGDPAEDIDPAAEDLGAGPLVQPAPRQEVFAGPDKVDAILADPGSHRVLLRVHDSGQVWWVFDGRVNQFVGTVGIGAYNHGHTTFGLDPDIGRLYVLAAAPTDSPAPGGLYVADIRRNPLPQALHYPHAADPPRQSQALEAVGEPKAGRTMSVESRDGGATTRLFQTTERNTGKTFRVIVDSTGGAVDAEGPAGAVRSLDIDEAEGVTEATFDGTARGFGFRAILIGGLEGAARVGSADPIGAARGVREVDARDNLVANPPIVPVAESAVAQLPPPDPCANAQREVILAFVGPKGPAVVDASSARGEAQPVLADVRTQDDVRSPASRCGPKDWAGLWSAALVSQAPTEEPGVEWPFDEGRSSCTTTQEEANDSWRDPLLGAFASRVECSEDEVSGWGQARGLNMEGVSVADTLSTFRIYRDPERGLVSRVESIARGINVAGVVKINTVRGAAESWANGRQASEEDPDAVPAEDSFNPYNCDTTRPAGTCFQRHVFGVTAIAPDGKRYGCGPCGDEAALIEGVNRALGANGMARFREPNEELARGSEDGYIAAITKKDKERFADIVLNNDLLETMVPMLEIIRYAPHNRPADPQRYSLGSPPRGRQVYQFAAVEVSSTYSVQCLLVYDEATNTCAEAAEAPGSIQVSLSDPDGGPLAGGAFELREDVDADGVLGLKDTLLPDGACVTAEDGVGTCTFEGLQPGTYLVSQVAAPPGYAKSSEPWVSEVASGEQRIVAFTNVSNVSTIDMTVTDEDGAPLSGASFAAYPDPDADGKVAPEATPAATCTTDAQGVCSMQVPAGSYVLVQTGAPGGLEGIEPVAFTFASGGQVAAVTVVNYPPSQPASPEGAASPEVVYSPPVDSAPPMESVSDFTPAQPVPDSDVTVAPPVLEQIGGTVVQVIRAPGDALRLLARDPKQAVAWTAALMLFVLAVMAVRRRQAAIALIQQ